jgi:hypothetical protein
MTRSLAQFSLLCTKCAHRYDVYDGDEQLVLAELCSACYMKREMKIRAGVYWTIVAITGGFVYLVCRIFT